MSDNANVTSATSQDVDRVPGIIRSAWADVLSAEAIEPDTHFFDFGGHSVTAMRMMVRLRRDLDTPLPTRLIFDNPVLSDFTQATQQQLADARA